MTTKQTIKEVVEEFHQSFVDEKYIGSSGFLHVKAAPETMDKWLQTSLRKVALAALDEIRLEDIPLLKERAIGSEQVELHFKGGVYGYNQANSLIREQIEKLKKELV